MQGPRPLAVILALGAVAVLRYGVKLDAAVRIVAAREIIRRIVSADFLISSGSLIPMGLRFVALHFLRYACTTSAEESEIGRPSEI